MEWPHETNHATFKTMNEAKLGQLPTDFACCQCKAPMLKGMSMIGHTRPVVRKGMIVVCSNCCTVHILGDSQLAPITKQQFEAMPMPHKAAIAQTVKQLQAKLVAGGEWNPHE